MIKLHPKKILNIFVIIFVFGMGLIMTNLNDRLKLTRDELTKLYEVNFDSCMLTKLEKRKYPERGDYQVFYTSCSDENFPILLELNSNWRHPDLFKENVILTKKSKSVELRISDNGIVTNVRLRNPKDEDTRPFGAKVALIFMSVCTILIILLPNSLYEGK